MQRLEGRDIVCFANDWSGDPLSKKHVMRRLARSNRVLWCNSLGNRAPRAQARDLRRAFEKIERFAGGLAEVEPNIHVLSPLAVPDYRSPFIRRVNALVVGTTVRAAMRRLAFRRPLLYTFVPASAWVASALGCERLVYHCVDDYAAFDGAGEPIARLEAELVRRSDLVIVCSQPLYHAKRRLNPKTVLVRHGVEHQHFARALLAATPLPVDVVDLPRPILGFYGLLAEWIDLEVFLRLADAFPGGSVVVVGGLAIDRTQKYEELYRRPNVHILGRRPYEALPGYCKAFDIALLPFVKNELTQSSSPLKLREYLAAGLPVVATDIPEARTLLKRGVWLADSPDAFVAGVTAALQAGAGPDPARSADMADESWDTKVAQIENKLVRLSP
jgi:glycosyltransferase involved in cell wall biosynthesis